LQHYNFKPICERTGGRWFGGEAFFTGGLNKLPNYRNCDCFYKMLDKNCDTQPFDFAAIPTVTQKSLIREEISRCSYKPNFFLLVDHAATIKIAKWEQNHIRDKRDIMRLCERQYAQKENVLLRNSSMPFHLFLN